MSFSLGESVWKRANSKAGNELSQRAYAMALCFFTVLGVVGASLVSYATRGWQVGIFGLLLVGLGIPILGIVISAKSDDWRVSLFGYLLVFAGMGAIIGPVVATYKISSVMVALAATGGVTVVMSLIGALYPKSLEHWASYLFGALLALIAVRLMQMLLVGFGVAPSHAWYWTLIEYGSAVLFSLYIIYDWNRAMRLPYTLDNAVDCSVALFIDIINLFLNLLSIIGGSKD